MNKKIFALILSLIMTFAFTLNCFALQSPSETPISTRKVSNITLKPTGSNYSGQWVKSNKNGLTFQSNTSIKKSVPVYVDGKKINSSKYTINGKTITLSPDFLNTLSKGKHTLAFKMSNQTITSPFVISAKTNGGQGNNGGNNNKQNNPNNETNTQTLTPSDSTISPKTSDNSHYVIYAGLFLISLSTLAVTVFNRKSMSN
jgi:hypothetical protein